MSGQILDCGGCGARYMRQVVPLNEHERGEYRCPCGEVLGEWDGAFRLAFDPEDQPTTPIH